MSKMNDMYEFEKICKFTVASITEVSFLKYRSFPLKIPLLKPKQKNNCSASKV